MPNNKWKVVGGKKAPGGNFSIPSLYACDKMQSDFTVSANQVLWFSFSYVVLQSVE